MIGAVVLVGLNIADAWLLRMRMQLVGVELNPLASPLEANPAARALIAVAAILALYLVGKSGLIWWLVLAVLGLMTYHGVGYYVSSLNSTPS